MTPMAEWNELANFFRGNEMREAGLEPACLAAPDPKSSAGGEQAPQQGLPLSGNMPALHRIAPDCTRDVTAEVTRPVAGSAHWHVARHRPRAVEVL